MIPRTAYMQDAGFFCAEFDKNLSPPYLNDVRLTINMKLNGREA